MVPVPFFAGKMYILIKGWGKIVETKEREDFMPLSASRVDDAGTCKFSGIIF
jgi:hypothetical protein